MSEGGEGAREEKERGMEGSKGAFIIVLFHVKKSNLDSYTTVVYN